MGSKPKSVTDEQLIYKTAEGDSEAFAELVHRYLASLVKFSARYTHSISYSEDIVQDLFLQVWKNAGSWDTSKGTAKSWLFRIAYNGTMDQLRRQKLQRSHPETLNSELQVVHSPEEALIDSERRSQVHDALFDLPERQRTALTLYLANGLSGSEVASVLGLTIEASDSLLARARRNLKKIILQEPLTKRAANL